MLSDDRVDILDVRIDFLDMEAAIARVVHAARDRRFFQVATVNLDFLVNSRSDHEVGAILNESHLNLPDGAPVVWAGRMLGLDGISRLAGADVVPQVIAAAERENLSVFLLGGEAGAAGKSAQNLLTRHPRLQVTTLEPPHSSLADMDDELILSAVHDARPHILLVAFGHPKQEKWIYRNRDSLPMVAMGVGCCFDLMAGRHERAPEWVQKAGLEWGYRLAHEPRRLAGRYATDGLWAVRDLFPWLILRRLSVRVAERVG